MHTQLSESTVHQNLKTISRSYLAIPCLPLYRLLTLWLNHSENFLPSAGSTYPSSQKGFLSICFVSTEDEAGVVLAHEELSERHSLTEN